MYIVGITGASGSIIGIRLIEELLKSGKSVSSIVSASAWDVIRHEVAGAADVRSMAGLLDSRGCSYPAQSLHEYRNDDMFAPPASGSYRCDAVIVAPCSMKSLAGIASGYAETLILRAADVALKEGRRCILVPRETPLSLVHIENMLRVKRADADIVPPVPGFYTQPRTIDDIINFITGKILNLLGIEHSLFGGWGDEL